MEKEQKLEKLKKDLESLSEGSVKLFKFNLDIVGIAGVNKLSFKYPLMSLNVNLKDETVTVTMRQS